MELNGLIVGNENYLLEELDLPKDTCWSAFCDHCDLNELCQELSIETLCSSILDRRLNYVFKKV